MGRQRAHFALEEWPQADRLAFESAFEAGGLFDSQGLASHWARHTQTGVLKAYGHWLAFLHRAGWPLGQTDPAERMSDKALADYVRDMRPRMAPCSVVTRVRGLAEAFRIMNLSDAHQLASKAHNSLRRSAKTSRDKRSKLVAPSQLYWAGIARMDRYRESRDKTAAIRYSDGLIMAMLAAKPVRRKNLFETRIGVNLRKRSDGVYEWRFEAHETKTRERTCAELPASLVAYLDHWLGSVRAVLQGSGQSDAMWLTTRGTEMAIDTGYWRFCKATREELGVRINPHAVRDIVATGIAVEMPEAVGITAAILDHRSDQTAMEHYNLADQLSASARYITKIESLRHRELGANAAKKR